jgi:transcription-repair coupling factor (superfamily II helicase)
MRDMRKENNLVAPSKFREEICRFRLVEFGAKPTGTPQVSIEFHISPQPLFHKNFSLLTQTLDDYLLQGYQLYILADSEKQTQRLRDIFDSEELQQMRRNSQHLNTSTPQHLNIQHSTLPFTPVNRTLHEGFADNDLRLCFFTDHQIFDRFHKYNLKSDAARTGKMALTMKELQEMEPGDFIVHVDFGIGKFGGLVRVPVGDSYQEMIRLYYQRGDIVDVSIHSLYKISKYRRSDTKGLVRYRGEIKRKIPAGQPYVENGQTLISDGTAEISYVGDRAYDPSEVLALHGIQPFTTAVKLGAGAR